MEEKAKAGDDDEIVQDNRLRAAWIASTKKKKRSAVDDGASASGASLCDDVICNILAYLPARTAVASMALSKRHRDLIRSAEFRSLHCRLGAPLPRPHIAYIATAPVRYKRDRGHVVNEYHGFHVAGAGAEISSRHAPMRAISGDSYLGYRFVNTCNGVVLLATNVESPHGRCVLWNPAVADVVREFTVPAADPYPSMAGGGNDCNYLVLGLGYGRRSETYKLLLLQTDYTHWKHSLQVYALVGGGQPRLRPAAVPSPGIDDRVIQWQCQQSLYMDGTLYFLDVDRSEILAFDVDNETVETVRLPGKRDGGGHTRHARSRLMEMHGRLCVATNHGHHDRAGLWLLAADRRQWECRCVIDLEGSVYHYDANGDTYDSSVTGVWDCGGVLAVHIQGATVGNNKLRLYQLATGQKMFDAKLPRELPDDSDYALCWGYRPMLVSPQSILELSQDEDRRRNNANVKDIMEALKPIRDKDSREGPKAILDTVCFMEFLVSIMRKLPDDIQDVIRLPMLLDSVDSDVVSDNDSHDPEDDDARGVSKYKVVSCSGSDSDSD